jgi:hypothetical protein
MINMFKKTKEQIELEYQTALKQKQELEAIETAEEKRKNDLLLKKESAKTSFNTRCKVYGINQPASIRWLLFLSHCQKFPPAIIDRKVWEAYRVVEIMESLNKMGLPPAVYQEPTE